MVLSVERRRPAGERTFMMTAKSIALMALAVTLAGCGSVKAPETVTSRAPLTSSNGVWENGLTTNGVWENGVWENGVWENGVWENGVWENGVWENGVWENGVWENGVWENGVLQNGVWENGVWENGVWANGVWENGLPGERLRSSPYARQLLQYVYACAMPGSFDPSNGNALIDPRTYDTTIDPNIGAPISCSTSADCDFGYGCSAHGTCVVPLTGAIGVGVNADGSTWWGTGRCDESCQRWVSACVLARANAYGVHVDISMRAPADAPPTIKNALLVSDEERDGGPGILAYSHREGAYFGNIFATAPTTPPPAGGNGAATGPIAGAPAFFACAGPESNTPEITNRFCSSQGDQVVIQVPGVCLSGDPTAFPTVFGICAGEDTDLTSNTRGAIQDCRPHHGGSGACTDFRDPNCYNEVITIYLKQPIAVCGNAVCETGEADSSNPAFCESDCHPGTWARDFHGPFNFREDTTPIATGPEVLRIAENGGMFALGPDDTIVVTGKQMTYTDLGGGPFPSAGVGDNFVLARYNSDATFLWDTRFGRFGACTGAPPGHGAAYANCTFLEAAAGLAVAPNGDIKFVGNATSSDSLGNDNWAVVIGTLDPNVTSYPPRGATPIPDPTVLVAGPIGVASQLQGVTLTRAVAIDAAGNVIFAASYAGTATFGSFTVTSSIVRPPFGEDVPNDIAVVKVTPAGQVVWATTLDVFKDDVALSLAVDSVGNVILTAAGNAAFPAVDPARHILVKFASSDGAVVWGPIDSGPSAIFSVVGVDPNDPNGDVYVGGYFGAGQDFGAGPLDVQGLPPFLAKYRGADGTRLWVSHATVVCPQGHSTCGDSFATLERDRLSVVPLNISFDTAGNVVLGTFGNAVVGGGIDFGHGTFRTFSANNAFLAAYAPGAGTLVWAKQIPLILGSNLLGLVVDRHDRVVVGGAFYGSMQVDDKLLVTNLPEDANITVDAFLASFSSPSPVRDTSPPTIGLAHDNTGRPVLTVPKNMVVEATSATGALVFYMPPTAIDDGNTGTSVTCSPPPNTMFPLGRTPVTCSASDPLNHRSPDVTFTVTVVDTRPPFISQVPANMTAVEATGPGGAIVTYPLPTAIDQVDGSRPVICDPPSGSKFGIQTTTVTCTSSDTRGNTSSATFGVTVVDTTPPVLTLPGTISATATSIDGAVVHYSASAADLVDGAITPVCTRASGSTFALGTITVTCTATDAHGNVATGTFQVNVHYGWCGVRPPIDNDGSSVFKLGSTVPVKFRLAGASSGITNAAATLWVAKITSSGTGPYAPAVSTSGATTGNAFSSTAGQYIFNLSTRGMSAGKWSLLIDLGDGLPHAVMITLR
jgi:hypothetical protein